LIESEDADLLELERVLRLEAMMAVKVLEDWRYPERWLPDRRVFLVGAGLWRRQRAGVVVQEALAEDYVYDDGDEPEPGLP
jgi:hypothetical protein